MSQCKQNCVFDVALNAIVASQVIPVELVLLHIRQEDCAAMLLKHRRWVLIFLGIVTCCCGHWVPAKSSRLIIGFVCISCLEPWSFLRLFNNWRHLSVHFLDGGKHHICVQLVEVNVFFKHKSVLIEALCRLYTANINCTLCRRARVHS
jgi:hypothetical protein